MEISKAIASSDVILIWLSQDAKDNQGCIQKGINFALDKAAEIPEGRIFIIPVRLSECTAPESMQRYPWVGLFGTAAREGLVKRG